MPCFVERILPGQEGEVRQSAEGNLLPGKTHTSLSLSLSLSLSHTHTLSHTLGCYVKVNKSATSCSWHKSATHV